MYNVGCCLNSQDSLRLRLHFFIYMLHIRGPRGAGGGGFGGDKPGVASHYSRKEEDLETLWKNNSTTGINFSKYERIPVHVEGDGKPRQVIRRYSVFSLC